MESPPKRLRVMNAPLSDFEDEGGIGSYDSESGNALNEQKGPDDTPGSDIGSVLSAA